MFRAVKSQNLKSTLRLNCFERLAKNCIKSRQLIFVNFITSAKISFQFTPLNNCPIIVGCLPCLKNECNMTMFQENRQLCKTGSCFYKRKDKHETTDRKKHHNFFLKGKYTPSDTSLLSSMLLVQNSAK